MLWKLVLSALLLVQDRGEIAVMTAVITVLLYYSAVILGISAVLLVLGRGEVEFMTEVTAVLLHHCAMDTGTDCSVVRTGNRGNCGYACSYGSTFTSVCYEYRDLLQCC